jgi:hypothetical protein
MRRLAISCALLTILGWVGPIHAQQQITILWVSKQPQSGPMTVDQSTPVHIVVTGVNDALYYYEGYVTSVPTPPPNIQFPAAPAAPGAAAACASVTSTLKTIASDMKGQGGPRDSWATGFRGCSRVRVFDLVRDRNLSPAWRSAFHVY